MTFDAGSCESNPNSRSNSPYVRAFRRQHSAISTVILDAGSYEWGCSKRVRVDLIRAFQTVISDLVALARYYLRRVSSGVCQRVWNARFRVDRPHRVQRAQHEHRQVRTQAGRYRPVWPAWGWAAYWSWIQGTCTPGSMGTSENGLAECIPSACQRWERKD